MKIKKGTPLLVNHQRKGIFKATATKTFDTDDNWYPITASQTITGKVHEWQPGEAMQCRKDLCTVTIETQEQTEGGATE